MYYVPKEVLSIIQLVYQYPTIVILPSCTYSDRSFIYINHMFIIFICSM